MLEEFGVHLEEAKKKCVKQYLGISDTLTHMLLQV